MIGNAEVGSGSFHTPVPTGTCQVALVTYGLISGMSMVCSADPGPPVGTIGSSIVASGSYPRASRSRPVELMRRRLEDEHAGCPSAVSDRHIRVTAACRACDRRTPRPSPGVRDGGSPRGPRRRMCGGPPIVEMARAAGAPPDTLCDAMSESSTTPPSGAGRRGAGAGSKLSGAHRRAVAELLRVWPVADEIGTRFAAAGFELHLVGGSVRDALLGQLGDDLDFATDARPEQTQRLLDGWAEAIWTTGAEFGTIGAARHGMRLEITTYRADSYDRVSRNPIVTYGTSLTEDLRRRDFTVNAMAVSVPGHEFTDPYGGREDLARGLIRTPGAPEQSFGDDPLRMLRAARFAAKLRFAVAPEVLAAMAAMAPDLARITDERIRDEFAKLMTAADPITGLRLLVDTGLADQFLPELSGLKLEIDEHAQHKDVYEHTLIVVANAMRQEKDGADFVL